MNNDIAMAKELKPNKYELETANGTYILELDNESIMIADKMNLINSLQNMGIVEMASNIIYVFAIKNHREMTPNLASKIANTIINEKEYDIEDLLAELIDEFLTRYKQVFISKDKNTRKKIKKI